ncbi:MAG: ComEA family DNA-binding protein [Desulfurellaceae bacterium]|nr:ComEA family DNA-binding protein [Desulfurellaceae bacterium]
MKQKFLWLALGIFAVGCVIGAPVWADHHEAAEKMAEAADETMPEAAGPIDINMADAAALQTLPGIGETKAAAIIAHREANGPFATVDDLQNVTGIGEKTLEKLKEQITVGASE